LDLPDANGRTRHLTEFNNRNVMLVFFLGSECSHCALQLRKLVNDARGEVSKDTEIIAVSSEPIKDSSRIAEMLGITPKDHVQVLVDETLGAFRAFGCHDGRPLHGLFLIDRKGVIRAKYVGTSAFSDTREAVRNARLMGSANGNVGSP
jgi:peroxiredoxin